MDKHLIKVFDLEPNVNDITPIDCFKLLRDFEKFISTLHEYAAKNQLNDIEKYYFDLETDPRRKFLESISETYFNNHFLQVYFVLSNPVLIKTKTFDNLYRDRDLLPAVADKIINQYKTMDAEASRFFTKSLFDKFIKGLNFVPLADEVTSPEYKEYFKLFLQESTRLKEFLVEFSKDPKWTQHQEKGLSQFDPKYYQFAFEYNTGLKIESPDKFRQLKQWAQRHLDRLMNEVDRTCDLLLTNAEDKKKTTREKMLIVGLDPTQHWSSKQEMVDAHELAIAKYRRIFVAEHQFKEFNPPGLIIVDNPLLAGGYYYKDRFYLNVCEWAQGNFKYDVETLVLHETVPGHHLQLDISYHSPHHNYLTTILQTPCNGFCEGWGLFAEHLGDSTFDNPWNYFGYLQANILRTFRIIAEVLLHIEGESPANVIELAKQYLTTSEAAITAEVYRYLVLPGQACGYKTGLEVFKTIIKKKFNVDQLKDLKRDDLLEWYKEVLWQAERPLDLFLRENDLTWSLD